MSYVLYLRTLFPNALTNARYYNKIDAVRLFGKGCLSGALL